MVNDIGVRALSLGEENGHGRLSCAKASSWSGLRLQASSAATPRGCRQTNQFPRGGALVRRDPTDDFTDGEQTLLFAALWTTASACAAHDNNNPQPGRQPEGEP